MTTGYYIFYRYFGVQITLRYRLCEIIYSNYSIEKTKFHSISNLRKIMLTISHKLIISVYLTVGVIHIA